MQAKLRWHKRAPSRKYKNLRRREFSRRELTRTARRLANARKAWSPRTCHRLAAEAGTILSEKLNTRA